jgi:preprotein translocase subunit SecA
VRPASSAPSTTIDAIERDFQRKKQRELEHARMAGGGENGSEPAQRRSGEKVGRNDPCPCGSGKKYKKCHGAGEA